MVVAGLSWGKPVSFIFFQPFFPHPRCYMMDDEVKEVRITWQGSERSRAGDMLNPSTPNQPHVSSRALSSYKWTLWRQQSAGTSAKTLKGWAEVTDPGWLMRKDGVFHDILLKGNAASATYGRPVDKRVKLMRTGCVAHLHLLLKWKVGKLQMHTKSKQTEKNRLAAQIKREQIIHMTRGGLCGQSERESRHKDYRLSN